MVIATALQKQAQMKAQTKAVGNLNLVPVNWVKDRLSQQAVTKMNEPFQGVPVRDGTHCRGILRISVEAVTNASAEEAQKLSDSRFYDRKTLAAGP